MTLPTLSNSSPPADVGSKLDLSALPPVFVSSTHFDLNALHEIEEGLVEANASLTYDANEAGVVLSKASKKARVQFDLRSLGIWTRQISSSPQPAGQQTTSFPDEPRTKKRKTEDEQREGFRSEPIVLDDDDSTTASESESEPPSVSAAGDGQELPSPRKGLKRTSARPSVSDDRDRRKSIKVVRADWFTESRRAGKALPIEDFLTLDGIKIERPQPTSPKQPIKQSIPSTSPKQSNSQSILQRAKEDAPATASSSQSRFGRRTFKNALKPSSGAAWEAGHGSAPPNNEIANLLRTTTSDDDNGYPSDLPEMPDWVKQGAKYACQRASPRRSHNSEFIAQLQKIRAARELAADEIGVRAYSTSIASISAYPRKLTSARELLALPGCDAKIASLFAEFTSTGALQAVAALDADPEQQTLRLFADIWGVGPSTARHFYHDLGWRDLDDLVHHGWATVLTRAQKLGVKFYHDFLDPIPRLEVEQIARRIHRAAGGDAAGIHSLIVGGYRRGKPACADVDVLLSHPQHARTLNLVVDVVAVLEAEGYITHTLSLHTSSSARDQRPRSSGGGSHHHHGGFDALDKALVVWQDPVPTPPPPQSQQQGAERPAPPPNEEKEKEVINPNIHRRVDIIVAPWRTVGCAVVGWTGDTTFERDLRRFARKEKGWRFDSSGVRRVDTGEVVDVEGYEGKGGPGAAAAAGDMLEAERRVFEAMGLVYREPWERVTG